MIRIPASVVELAGGSILFVSPFVEAETEGHGRNKQFLGTVIDLTDIDAGSGWIECRAQRGSTFSDQIRVETREIVAHPQGKKLGDKPLCMERWVIEADGAHRFILPSEAFSDFDSNKHKFAKIEMLRWVIPNKGENEAYGKFIPVSKFTFRIGKLGEQPKVADFAEVDESMRTGKRLPWTKLAGRKGRRRVKMLHLEDGLYALLLPNSDGADPQSRLGSMAAFDHLGREGVVELVGASRDDKALKVWCREFTTGEKGRKIFGLLFGTDTSRATWVGDDAEPITEGEGDGKRDCDLIAFGVAGSDKDGWYPDAATVTYRSSSLTNPQRRRQGGTPTVRTRAAGSELDVLNVDDSESAGEGIGAETSPEIPPNAEEVANNEGGQGVVGEQPSTT